MASAFTLFGEIKVNTQGLDSSLKRAETSLKKTTAELNRAEKAGHNAARGMANMRNSTAAAARSASSLGAVWGTVIGSSVGALAGFAIKTATSFDSLTRALTAVTGSSAVAAQQLIRLKEVAKSPGLGFREAIQGSVNLQAAGLSAQLAERSLMAFGNALATVGKGKADLDGVITALSQIQSKGKISAEEINQLAERLPQIRVAMQQAFGTADTEKLAKMGIDAQAFINKVVTEFEKLPKVVGGAQNSFDNFKDAVEQAILPLGNILIKAITPALDKLAAELSKDNSNLHTAAKTLGEQIGEWINQGLREARNGTGGGSSSIVADWFKDSGLVGPIVRGMLKDAGYTPDMSGFMLALEKAGNALNQLTARAIRAVIKMNTDVLAAIVMGGPRIAAAAIRIGVELVQGFINGIQSKAGEAAAAVSNFFKQNAIARAEGVLDVQSPSKVFFRIGKDTAQGYIDGLASMKTGVYAAMASMLDVSGAKGLGKKDAAGVELLTELIRELDQLTPRTRSQAVAAQLTAGAYKNLNAEVRKRIELAAEELTKLEKIKEFYDAIARRFQTVGSGDDDAGAGGGRTLGDSIVGWRGLGDGVDGGTANPFEAMIDRLTGGIPKVKALWSDFWATMIERLDYFKSQLPSLKQAIGENLISSIYGIGDVFANAVTQWDGTAKGFFKSLAAGFKQLVSQIVAELVRLMVIKAIMSLIGGIAGGFGGGSGASSVQLGSWGSVTPAGPGGGGFLSGLGGIFRGMSAAPPMLPGGGGGGGGMSAPPSSTFNNTVTVNMPGGTGSSITPDQIKRAVLAALAQTQQRNK